jgi:thioredoxin-like negative regulator of GroEL
MSRLGFKSTPHIVLLRADGTKVREFIGGVEEAELRVALNQLASRPTY